MQIAVSDLKVTQRLGKEIADAVSKQAIFALKGSLGAGKTALVKAVGAALGVTEVISSPTFTMLNEYHSGRLPLYHLDLYRAGETGEVIDLSMLALELEEASAEPMIMMVEWPEYFLVDGANYLDGLDHIEIKLEFVKGSQVASRAELAECAPGVLRETSKANVHIKDGEGEARTLTLTPFGQESQALVGRLSGALGDILINL
jgi:tRNA threonylcarbamoyladenosine biosynthesis protein TsaE